MNVAGKMKIAKNLIFLGAVLLLNALSLFSSQEYEDLNSALEALSKSKPDTNKVILLQKIGSELEYSDPNKALEYAFDALELSKELDWENGMVTASNLIAIIYDTNSDFEKAIDYYRKSIAYAGRETSNEKAVSLMNLGITYLKISEDNEAKNCFDEALDIFIENGDKEGEANILKLMGSLEMRNTNYGKALTYYFDALKISEEINDTTYIAGLHQDIGDVYEIQSELDKALEYYNKALQLSLEYGRPLGIAYSYKGLASIYESKNDYEKSTEYYHEALEIFENTGSVYELASIQTHLSYLYSSISQYEKALEYSLKSLEVSREIGYLESVAVNLNNIGEYYLLIASDSFIDTVANKSEFFSKKEMNIRKALDNFEESLSILKETEDLRKMSLSLANIANAHAMLGNFEKSLELYKEHHKLQDSVFSMDKATAIAGLESVREVEKKNNELNIVKANQRLRTTIFVAGSVLLLILLLAAYLRFREKKKLSENLAQKNKIIEEKNTQILDSIDYASTIQHAIFPWKSNLDRAFIEYFILFKPKDVVSGDCYWFKEVGGINFLAAIDCTGHGVPGSMLSVVAINVLDDAVLNRKLTDTGQILTFMNSRVTEILNQNREENKSRDGMEVCLVAISRDKIQYSGAGRPLFVKNGEIQTYKTDRRGIAGSRLAEDDYIFGSEIIEATPGNILYLTTDGYPDQLNEERKKMGTKRFKELLEGISEKPMLEQKEILDKEFAAHIGSQEQTDDVTVIGIMV